ncbi:MAG: POTRA domain-containing protein [Polyangiales bacterium]
MTLRSSGVDDEGRKIDTLESATKLRDTIKLDNGEWFSRSKVAEGIDKITLKYRDAGYAKVLINPGTDLHEDTQVVDVQVGIRRGPPVYIERINIVGNTKTRDRVIRREFRVYEGQLYNQTKIDRAKQFINALSYFETVNVS